jgi:DNA-binding transcriptional ArsR family regulator
LQVKTMTEYAVARKAAAMLAALAEPTRLRIAFHLARGPHHVTQLAELLEIPMVNMSHHLGVMRQSGLLDDEKEGRRVRYFFRDGILEPGDGREILATLVLGAFRVVLRASAESPAGAKPRGKPKPAK